MSLHARVELEPKQALGRIDPNIYGQFLSRRRWVVESALYDPAHPEADATGVRRDVREALAAAAPPVVRWPGGCTGTSYQWRDGVGPLDERPRSIDWHFGYDVGNEFGTAEFVGFCRSIGAEPQINLPIGTESLRDALDWVEYVNADTPSRWANLRRQHGNTEPFNVRYWQIGNEEWGNWEIGHRAPGDYAALAREWGKALKKLDPGQRVLAAGCWHGRNLLDWNTEVLRAAWHHIDYLTAHTYWWFDPESLDEEYDLLAATGAIEERAIIEAAGLIDLVAREKGSDRRPKLAFTEWNCGDRTQEEMSPQWRPGSTQYRLIDALACAGFLNALQRQCRTVTLATFAQSINVVGALVVTPEQVIKEPVYWPLWLQRHHSGNVSVPARVDCDGYTVENRSGQTETVPYLDVSVTRDDTHGRLYLSVVNRHRYEEVSARVFIPDAANVSARMWRLWSGDPADRNTADHPEAVAPVESSAKFGNGAELAFPPHSYTVLEAPLPV